MQNRVYFTESFKEADGTIHDIDVIISNLLAENSKYCLPSCKVVVSDSKKTIVFVHLEDNYYFLKVGYAQEDEEYISGISDEVMSILDGINLGRETRVMKIDFLPIKTALTKRRR